MSASSASNRATSTSPRAQSPVNASAPASSSSAAPAPQNPFQTEPSDAHPSWLTTAPTQTPFNNPYQQPQYNPAPFQHGGNPANNFMPNNFDPQLQAQYMQQANSYLQQAGQHNGSQQPSNSNTLQPPIQHQQSNSASAPVTPQRSTSSEPAAQHHSATPPPTASHTDTLSGASASDGERSADSHTDT